MAKKSNKSVTKKNKYNNAYYKKCAMIVSAVISMILIVFIVFLTKYPLIIKMPIARFFLFSISMMLPTLVITSITFPLGIGFPKLVYLGTAFVLYFLIFYAITYFYLKQDTNEKKRIFLAKIATYIVIFVASSMAYLAKTFYG